MVRRLSTTGVGALLALLGASTPAAAQEDTTPPTLVSLSVSPTVVDVSSSAQTVTVTAVITDDLSGVCADGDSTCTHATSSIRSPSAEQSVLLGYPVAVSGDTYTLSGTIPQYAEEGIWKDWSIQLTDKAGNMVVLDEADLLALGINAAVGVGSFDATYARTISLFLSRRRASGFVDSDTQSTCFWYVPVTVERKTASGWRTVRSTIADHLGFYSVRIRKFGRYRATATAFDLGTPTITTCERAAARKRLV
jgi:hypothetical protein